MATAELLGYPAHDATGDASMTQAQIDAGKHELWHRLTSGFTLQRLLVMEGETCYHVVALLAIQCGLYHRYDTSSICEFRVADAFMRFYRPSDAYTAFCREIS